MIGFRIFLAILIGIPIISVPGRTKRNDVISYHFMIIDNKTYLLRPSNLAEVPCGAQGVKSDYCWCALFTD